MRRFLEGFLPARLSAVLDYDSLEDSKETFLTPGLKKSMGDLVFRCRTRDGDQGTIYVVFEHVRRVGVGIERAQAPLMREKCMCPS